MKHKFKILLCLLLTACHDDRPPRLIIPDGSWVCIKANNEKALVLNHVFMPLTNELIYNVRRNDLTKVELKEIEVEQIKP